MCNIKAHVAKQPYVSDLYPYILCVGGQWQEYAMPVKIAMVVYRAKA